MNEQVIRLFSVRNNQGGNIDPKRSYGKKYFVKKFYQDICDPNRPMDADSVQLRIIDLCKVEKILRTKFKRSQDLRREVEAYLKKYKDRKESIGKRIRRARKKKGWTQEQLAKHLSISSRVSISHYERGIRPVPEKVMRWLEKMEK